MSFSQTTTAAARRCYWIHQQQRSSPLRVVRPLSATTTRYNDAHHHHHHHHHHHRSYASSTRTTATTTSPPLGCCFNNSRPEAFSLVRLRHSSSSSPFQTTWSPESSVLPSSWNSTLLRFLSTSRDNPEKDDNEAKEEERADHDKPTIPRGFQEFFPPKARRKPPAAAATASEEQQHEETNVENSSESSKQQLHLESSDKSESSTNEKDKKQQGKQQQTPPPPPDESFDNLPGLLALLAIIVTLRSWLESDAADHEGGQEITFVDFRNRFLSDPTIQQQVQVLQIVNKKMARVILKKQPESMTASAGAVESGGAETGTATTTWKDDTGGGAWEHQNNGNNMAMSEHHNNRSRNTNIKKRHAPPVYYYFYIGSVESLEEKLALAQQHLHPAQWIEVQYVTKTNYALEAFKALPILAFMAAIYFGSRSVVGMGGSGSAGGKGGGMGGIFSIGRSPAKKIKKEDISITFADVAGCDQAKMEITEFCDFLKDPSRFTKLGAKIPKGALLCGPPGTGKTLLAKAVAGESGVPFYSISGSDFIEMFVGVGPSRVRDLFKEARQNAPCIVFIDEIDAVGRQRGRGGFSGGNDERENTLNQLLVEMDGFSPTTGVVVLAGTNRVDILDQALTRPGRFDRQIVVDRPDLQGRKDIFQVHLKNIVLEKGGSEEYAGRLAGLTPGFAGADIANICNEAAIVAARRKADAVTMDDFEKATDRIIGGLESNKIMSAEERSIVAHHEAGHAIAGWFLEHADPLLKVTIIPRTSGALGFAQYLPKEVFLRSQDQIMDIVCMALAGRAAEEVFFGRVTTGASDDLRRVTQLVYGMIKDFGMNSRLGQLAFPSDDGGTPGDKPYSDSTAEAMDEEARSIVDAAYQRTVELIREHRNDVEKLASTLLEKETITHDDIYDLVGPRPFESDSAYDEFVSHRARDRKDTEAKQKKKSTGIEKESTAIDNEDGGLTPGLA